MSAWQVLGFSIIKGLIIAVAVTFAEHGQIFVACLIATIATTVAYHEGRSATRQNPSPAMTSPMGRK